MNQKINLLAETQKIAEEKAMKAKKGDVFMLLGEPGSGKSTFVKYFLAALGLEYQGSPTFGYLNYYENPEIIHADLYNYGKNIVEELFEHSEAILLIEWADRDQLLNKLFEKAQIIHFYFDEKDRWIRID